jgi:hypothetical protein
MGAVACTTFTQPQADAGTPFAPEPTWLGRRFLRYTALVRWCWRTGVIDDDDLATWERLDRYQAELDRVRAEVVARPVSSVADLVDRLIIVAHQCDPLYSELHHDKMWPALAGALAAAGITPAECCEDAACSADALAGA